MRTSSAVLSGVVVMAVTLQQAARCEQNSATVRIGPLPAESLDPLDGGQCVCHAFHKASALTERTVIFSTTPDSGCIRLDSREHNLRHQSREPNGQGYINAYSGEGIAISRRTTEVQFGQVCGAYADSPLHGSCFAGTMTVRAGGKSTSVPIVLLCGC